MTPGHMMNVTERQAARLAVLLAITGIAAGCGSREEAVQPAATAVTDAGRFLLILEKAESAPDGRRCVLHVTARNETGHSALNVQAAWMATTQGFGSISDFQFLGDFEADEVRGLQLGIFGAPCDAVRDVTLSRAVCTVGPATDPPESCAGEVRFVGQVSALLQKAK